MSLRILVVDDQTMVRGALAALLSLEPDIEVCGQAGNGREALEVLGGMACSQDSAPAGAACTRPVDVVLLDVEMPVMDGIAACEAIRTRFPGTRVLMLTTFGRPGYVQRSLDAGASGFIVKDAPSEQLAEAVRRVNAGHRVIDPTLAVETLTIDGTRSRGPSLCRRGRDPRGYRFRTRLITRNGPQSRLIGDVEDECPYTGAGPSPRD